MSSQAEVEQDLLVSSDSHVIESPTLWSERLPASFREKAPRFPKGAGGFQAHPGGSDPAERLKEMLVDGVSAEVLYPTLALNLFHLPEAPLQAACFQVYNDWVAEYCQAAPERLIGIAAISTYDTAAAVHELERARKLGLRGAIIWQLPPTEIPFYSSHYENFWAAAQELEMPVSLHILTGHDWSRQVSTGLMGGTVAPSESRYGYRGLVNEKLLSAMNSLHDIIISGVLQRYPRLRLVLVENEIGWIPFVLNQWDKYFIRPHRPSAMPIDQAPSEYFLRQVFATFFNDKVGCRMLSWWGSDNCMWSNDYPHPNSTWPNSRAIVQRDLGALRAEVRAKLTWRTVVDLYNLKVPSRLQVGRSG